MKSRERSVSVYDLKVVTKVPRSDLFPVPISVHDALEIARELKGNRKPTWNEGEVQIRLEDWQFDARRNEHHLLINRADPTLSDIPFKDLRTGHARMAGKRAWDGIDYSTHLLVRTPGRRATGPALLLMSGGASLYSDRIPLILNRMLREAAKAAPFADRFKRDHPNGEAGRKVDVTHTFELTGHQSKLLQNILRNGHIEGMELISDGLQQLDADNSFVITSRILKVEPVQVGQRMSVTRLMQAIRQAPQADQIRRAKIVFKETGDDRLQSHTFDLNDLEAAFVLRERITFETDISPRYETINPLIIDKMRGLIP